MDRLASEFLARVQHNSTSTEEDWELELSTAEEAGNLEDALVALKQLPGKSHKKSLEKVLLSAICAGDASTAYKILSNHLKRSIKKDEFNLLVDAVTTAGNVKDFCEGFPLTSANTIGLLHTTIVIGACKNLHFRRHGSFPQVTLNDWWKKYKEELKHFQFDVSTIEKEGGGMFLLYDGLLLVFLGALLAQDLIKTEHFKLITSLEFSQGPD